MNKGNREIFKALVMISQVTITMLTPVVICTFLAYLIGEKTGATWVVILGFFIGCIAGFRSVYLILKRFLKK